MAMVLKFYYKCIFQKKSYDIMHLLTFIMICKTHMHFWQNACENYYVMHAHLPYFLAGSAPTGKALLPSPENQGTD
jgi:hypothetical protein